MKKLLVLLLSVACALCLAFSIAGCNSGSGIEGVYYLYENNQLDKNNFIKLENGKWSDENDDSGEYSVSGDSITIYAEFMGVKVKYTSGTVKNGDLFLEMGGENVHYYKEGSEPAGEHEHVLGEWIEEIPSTCTEKGIKGHYVCSGCGKYLDKDKNEIKDLSIPEHTIKHVDAKAATCTEKGWEAYDYCLNCSYSTKNVKDINPNGHSYGGNDKCDYCGKDRYVILGEYPQSEVRDLSLKAALDGTVGEELPSADDAHGWKAYDNYINGTIQQYMWYKDTTYLNKHYRGVYFTSYRPYDTNFVSSAKNSYQDDNGYEPGTVYWFEFNPIKWEWRVTADGGILLYSAVILDGMQFDGKSGGDKAAHPNNYMLSEVREWLTEVFYDEAFDVSAREKILSVPVENGSSSTHVQDNPNTCPDTFDNIFLPSYKDMTDAAYEFKEYFAADQARQLKATDYALSQGLFLNAGYGCGQWWLRTPSAGNENLAVSVFGSGDLYFSTETTHVCGIVPALRIKL